MKIIRFGERRSLSAPEMKSALWVSFWLVVMFAGDADLLKAVVALINRIAT